MVIKVTINERLQLFAAVSAILVICNYMKTNVLTQTYSILLPAQVAESAPSKDFHITDDEYNHHDHHALVISTLSSFTDEDELCMAKNIYFESRDQTIAGQVAVAQVTINRVANKYYPNTICEVVYENRQFSWYWDGKSDTPRDQTAWEQSELIADAVMSGSGHESLLRKVTHYHAVYVYPSWAKHMTLVAGIDQHLFYRL